MYHSAIYNPPYIYILHFTFTGPWTRTRIEPESCSFPMFPTPILGLELVSHCWTDRTWLVSIYLSIYLSIRLSVYLSVCRLCRLFLSLLAAWERGVSNECRGFLTDPSVTRWRRKLDTCEQSARWQAWFERELNHLSYSQTDKHAALCVWLKLKS